MSDTPPLFDWHLNTQTVERWCFINDVFSSPECDRIIEQANQEDLVQRNRGGIEGTLDNETVKKIRRTNVAWIIANKDENKWIFERLTGAINQINKQFYNFDLDKIENLQFSEYREDEKGFYGKHIDMLMNSFNVRKLSVSVQLTDETAYEGGDLMMHTGSTPYKTTRKKGSVIAFPSYTLHEVTPVTKGTRHSLVAWAVGPMFK